MDDDPEAVVFQLVQPAVARWHLLGEDGLQGRINPGGWRPIRQNDRMNMS